MRDEVFTLFIERFGEATHRVDASEASIEKYVDKLPDQLLTYWRDEGWASYANGLLWTVDPDDYEDLIDEWLDDTPLCEIDAFHVIARTAFGDLYACGERSGCNLTIMCSVHAIIAVTKELRPKSKGDRDITVQSFFAMHDRDDCDLKDQNGKLLFERAREKLGPIGPAEIYGFEPAVVAGGRMVLDNLRKVELDVHLSLLRQLAVPKIPFAKLDLDRFLK